MSGKDQKKKFATLFSKGTGAGGRDSGTSDSEDEEKKQQAFYVGGEKSGQQVLGPPKPKGKVADIVENFFQQARQGGAEQIDVSQRNPAASAAGSSGAFSGSGYRLGDTVKPPEKVGTDSGGASAESESRIVTVIMRMWRNGFTINDGPLRTFEEPADRQFLAHITQGHLPPELIQANPGKKIDLEMEDHRHEDYKEPKGVRKAFTGQGQALGSPVPDVVGAGKVGEKAHAAASTPPAAAQVKLPVDESKPTTNIQVRLGNGERLIMKLNNTHTISDLRRFICDMRPDLASRQFLLMTGFPNKELTDESATLEEASLLNAVIIQRFK